MCNWGCSMHLDSYQITRCPVLGNISSLFSFPQASSDCGSCILARREKRASPEGKVTLAAETPCLAPEDGDFTDRGHNIIHAVLSLLWHLIQPSIICEYCKSQHRWQKFEFEIQFLLKVYNIFTLFYSHNIVYEAILIQELSV